MIQTLADLQPLILVTLLVLMYSIENVIPYLAKPVNKKQHDINNFIVTFISIVVNAFVGFGVLFAVNYTAEHQFGLLNQVQLQPAIEIIASILLMDFGSYCFHHLLHKVPFLWSFHRVHHSDTSLNTSSSLRFHPFEIIASQGLYMCAGVMLFGVSMPAFIIYGTIGLVFVIIQHTNIKFPDWLEKYGRYVFSTPGWHKIHHSDEQQYTDSHYGDIFTFWDRIFGTWHSVKPDEINYGLKEFADPQKQKAGFLLKSPFVKMKK